MDKYDGVKNYKDLQTILIGLGFTKIREDMRNDTIIYAVWLSAAGPLQVIRRHSSLTVTMDKVEFEVPCEDETREERSEEKSKPIKLQ